MLQKNRRVKLILPVLLEFVSEQSEWLEKKYPEELDGRLRGLLRLAKLTEEVGELSEQILGSMKQQRSTKKRKMDSDSVEEEVADVLITTLLLALTMKVDVEKALRVRMLAILRQRKT